MQSSSGQSVLDEIREQVEQGDRLGPDRVHADAFEALDPAFQRGQAEHRRRSGEEAVDAGRGPVIVGEGEGRGMAHPAAQRRHQPLLEMLGDVEEGGSARAAVQIFVAAADGELGSVAIEVERHRAGAVAEVPEGQSRPPPSPARSPAAMSKRKPAL